MATRILESGVSGLATIASALEHEYAGAASNDPWAGSPFAWIKTRPSRQVGKIGEQLVAGWCESLGLGVARTGDSQADRVIAGRRVEIKFSTLWKNGSYTFQQLRDQNYSDAICLGVSPFDAHAWVISKATLREHVIGHTPQHTGHGGTDTFWFSVDPNAPPGWLAPCGGSLLEAGDILRGWGT